MKESYVIGEQGDGTAESQNLRMLESSPREKREILFVSRAPSGRSAGTPGTVGKRYWR
jgi:hypothetical protein